MQQRQPRRKPTAGTAALHVYLATPEQPAMLEGIPGNAGEACETREYRAARATPVALILSVLAKQQHCL